MNTSRPRPSAYRGLSATLLVVAAGLAGCATGRSSFDTPTSSDRFFVAAYHPYWAGDAWTDYPEGVLDELYFFELEVAADGSFLDQHGWPGQWRAMVASALSTGLQVTPTVSMHDPDAFEQLFADADAVQRLVESVASLPSETPGLAGIHLDFEVFRPVDPAARDGFTAFAARVRARMDEIDPRLSLSVFTLAFDDDDVYNEPALGTIADYLVVQGYDYHSMGSSTTGPVAGLVGWGRLNWTDVVDRFVGLGVPLRKIVMAAPTYGYQWPAESAEPGASTRGDAVAIPYAPRDDVLPDLPRARAQAELHGVRRDPTSGAPYYVFQDDTGWHQGWFDDPTSLRAKYEFVRSRGLGGIAIFPAAYADEVLWTELERAFAGPRF